MDVEERGLFEGAHVPLLGEGPPQNMADWYPEYRGIGSSLGFKQRVPPLWIQVAMWAVKNSAVGADHKQAV